MSVFHFKEFTVSQSNCAMKVGTDAMLLGSLIDNFQYKNGLDVGAGTGVISLMIAQRNNGIQIEAVELDELSAIECSSNFLNSPWSDRLAVSHSDFLDYNPERVFDVIFSNPPYFQTNLPNEESRKAAARHVGSLTPGRFFDKVSSLLIENGGVWLILPVESMENWRLSAKKAGFFLKKEIHVLGKERAGVKRIVAQWSKENTNVVKEEVTVRTVEGTYTNQYIDLTKDFHGVDLNT